MHAARSSVLALLGVGFSIWGAGFVAAYAALSLGCAAGWQAVEFGPVTLQRAILVGLGLATTATCALAAALLAFYRRSSAGDGGAVDFVRTVAFEAALAATAAAVFTFSGVATLSVCGA